MRRHTDLKLPRVDCGRIFLATDQKLVDEATTLRRRSSSKISLGGMK
jgi:hypothetical protein